MTCDLCRKRFPLKRMVLRIPVTVVNPFTLEEKPAVAKLCIWCAGRGKR